MNIKMKDDVLEKQLKRDGYIIIPFLSKEEVLHLEKYSKENNNFSKEEMFYSNMKQHDKEYKDDTRAFIKDFFQDRLMNVVENAEILEGVFINKPPGYGEFANHQDWSIVNEKDFRTYCAWVPLIDVSEENGTFCVLEGSQDFFKGYRSSTIPWQYSDIEYEKIINKYRKTLTVKKGEALIFDNALIHATTPNSTKKDRTVILIGMKPKDEKIYHHFQTEDPNKVEVFEIDVDFFMTYDYVSRPEGYKSIGFFDNMVLNTTPEEFETMILDFKNKKLENENIK